MTLDLAPLAAALPEVVAGRPLVVLTGAGVSVESGLPTFRGAGGLWEGFRPEDLATPEAFEADPERVWRWYAWRQSLVRQARPNDGHIALARLERLLPSMTLITQNVDGLHTRAGSRNVLTLHGSIVHTRCTKDGARRSVPEDGFTSLPPRCPSCGGLLRPDVVWFGESLDPLVWKAAEKASLESAIFLVVGTSSVVAPSSSLALLAAREGAHVFEVNPEATPLAPLAEAVFRAGASEVLREVARLVAASGT